MGIIKMENQELMIKQEQPSLAIIEDQKAVEDFLSAIDKGQMDVFTAISKATEISTLIKNKIDKWDKEAEDKKKAIEDKASRSAKLGHKKEAIIGLQEVTKEIYSFQEDFVVAQKLSFANQTALGFISDALFRLGTINQSNYDSMVEKITMMLSDASQEELDEFSRRQLMKTLTDLKNQESMQKKYRALSNEVRNQNERLNAQDNINLDVDQQLNEIEKQNLLQDELIKQNKNDLEKQVDKDIEHDEKLAEIDRTDESQNEKISQNANKITEHEKTLENQKSKDDEHDEKLKAINQTDENQDERIAQNKDSISRHSNELEAQREKDIEHDLKFETMGAADEEHNKLIAENASNIEKLELLIEKYNDAQIKTNSKFGKMIADLDEKNSKEIVDLRSDFEIQILDLKSVIEKKQSDLLDEITQLKEQMGLIETKISKKIWKIAISVVAASSLLLNLLLIFGIL